MRALAGSVEAEATALGGLGDAYYLQGRLRSAHEQFARCVALAREHGLAKLEVTVLHMVGWSAEYLLMARSAVETGLQGVALAARLADPRAAMLSHSLVADLATRALGDLELAAAHVVRSRELARSWAPDDSLHSRLRSRPRWRWCGATRNVHAFSF